MIRKKKITIMLILILIMQIMIPLITVIIESDFTLFSIAVEGENSWDVSKNEDGSIIATLDENGVMRISGTGEMKNLYKGYFGLNFIRVVEISQGITSIGNEAFRETGVNEVTIPDSVTKIGEKAFDFCTNLTNITIPNSVISIGEEAFDGCWNLTNITIPNSVKDIGDSAFSYCKSLTNVVIPSSVTSIGDHVFDYCSSLNDINVESNNTNYCSKNGVLFNKEMTKIIKYPENKEAIEYIIPNSVTDIEKYAFLNCKNIKTVTMSNGVINIGYSAFRDCENLTNITLSNGITEINFNTFENCIKLSQIEIPNSVTVIEKEVFSNCQSLKNITLPSSLKSIEERAFYKCTNLREIIIPNNVTEIGREAFYYCIRLRDVTIPNSVTRMGLWPFYDCLDLTNVTLVFDNENLPYNLKKVFYECDNLKNINLEDNNQNYCVQDNVLFNKDMTKLIYYPEGKDATDYIIPNSVTDIENSAFKYCESLKSIIIPNNVTEIGDEAFCLCKSLTDVNIPDGLTEIKNSVFYGCDNLTNVTLPNGIIKIGSEAFEYCSSLTNIIIPDSVTSIGYNAFGNNSNLKNISLPNNVTETDKILQNSTIIVAIDAKDENQHIMPGILSRALNQNDILYTDKELILENCSLNETRDKIIVNSNEIATIKIQSGVLNELTIKIVPSGTITYSQDEWTKLNVNSILHITEGEKILNNDESSSHTFTQNGEFIYTYLTKNGEQKQITARVENIDKIAPVIKSVTRRIDDLTGKEYITIHAEDKESGVAYYGYTFNGGNKWDAYNWIEIKDDMDEVEIIVRDRVGNKTIFSGEIITEETVDTTTEIEEYEVKEDEDAKYIKGIETKTTINELKEKINTQGLVEIYKDNQKIEDESTKLGTGMEVIISFTNGESIRYTIVVTGDINGDGDVKASDLSKLKNALIGRTELGGAYKEAADTNGDGNLKASDLSKLKRMIVGV